MDSRRRCTAKSSRTGKRCRKAAIRGGTVCATHGGAAPQVRDAARRRLLELAEPAVAALAEALASGEWPSVVAAAKAILDRSGYGASRNMNVSGEPSSIRVVLVKPPPEPASSPGPRPPAGNPRRR